MIGAPLDHDLDAGDAGDGGDDTDVELLVFEDRPLFDMKFEEGRDVVAG